MVVDKDVEGLGEWTLGEVKTECVLLFRWKDQSRGYVCKIGQFPLHWENQIDVGLDVVCWGISTSCWLQSL